MSENEAPYGRDVVPPPELKKGQRVVVSNVKITQVEGDYGPQYMFVGELEDFNGYQARAWVKKYDDPSKKTKMYGLAVLADTRTKQWSNSCEEGLLKLQDIGRVYFMVHDFRGVKNVNYPKFAVVDDELPPPRQQQAPLTSAESIAKTDQIIKEIAAFQNMTVEYADKLVEEERSRYGGLLTDEAAVIIVAQRLGVDLAKIGIKA